MNCDEFPALYESDDARERRLAEEHAAGCPDCRETQRIIGLVRDELAIPVPLIEWETPLRKSFRPEAAPVPRRSEWLAVSAMTACLALAAAFVFVNDPGDRARPQADARPGIRQIAEIVRIEDDAPLQLGRLDSELDELSQRLDRIALHVVLLEERSQVASLKRLTR